MATRVCAEGELQPGGIVRVVHEGDPVAVFNVDGVILAIGDTCSHEESSLSEGYLEDHVIECPKHGAQFDVRDGRNITLPATRPVPKFTVAIENGEVLITGKESA